MTDDYLQFINERLLDYLPTDRIKSGDSLVFRCPFCGDSHKSAIKKRGYYTPRKGIYHCFNCDVSMSGYKLLEALSGNDFFHIKEDYIKLRAKCKVPDNISLNDDSVSKLKLSDLAHLESKVKPEWRNPLSDKAREYLDNRLVTKAPFLKDPMYSMCDNQGREYILIPWRLNGVECYYQFNDFLKHNPERKYVFPSKLQKVVYGLDNIDMGFPYVICFEGVYDSLFVKNGVCVGGKSLTALQEKLISLRYPRHRIVLAFDNDDAGITSMRKSISKTGDRFQYFRWFDKNEPSKDINDYIKRTGNIQAFSDKSVVEGMVVSSIRLKLDFM